MANASQDIQRGDAVERICEIGADFYRFGWLAANSGNASVRLGEDRLLITATGAHLGRLDGDDFVDVDLDGAADGDATPSSDTDVHLTIYRRVDDARAVFHLHHLEAALCSDRDEKRGFTHLHEVQMIRALDVGEIDEEPDVDLPIIENPTDHGELVEAVENRLDDDPPEAPCLNVKNHGLYVWGSSLAEVRRHTEALAYLYEYAWERPMNPKKSSSISGFDT